MRPAVGNQQQEDDLAEDIREGIEGAIGNTPLIHIKSLSEATGCEILAKAEVGYHPDQWRRGLAQRTFMLIA